MSCIEKIRELINSLELQAYTFIHFANSGTPNAIYQALAELKREGVIRGDARGVYSRINSTPPSVDAIAQAKAERFGKSIFSIEPARANEFRTDGCTSSFDTRAHGRIHFTHSAQKYRKQPVLRTWHAAQTSSAISAPGQRQNLQEENRSNTRSAPVVEPSVLSTVASLLREIHDLLADKQNKRIMQQKKKRRSLYRARRLLYISAKKLSEHWKPKLESSMAARSSVKIC